MPTIRINLTENVTPTMAAAIAELRGPALITASSRAVRNELREFYGGLEQTRPNRMGWPRQHFWADVRGTVQAPVIPDPTFATVSITHLAIRQRIEGGKIQPGPGKTYLTIPADERAYGHRAREFPNLRFGFAENRYGNLAPALVEASASRLKFGRKRKDGSRKVTATETGGDAFFWLVRQVFQPADPGAIASDAQLATAAVRGVTEYLTHLEHSAQKKLNALQKSAGSVT